MRRRRTLLLLLITLTLAGVGGCTQKAPKKRQAAGSGAAKGALRSGGLLQLIFSLTRARRDAAKRPRWVGCQLHLLETTPSKPTERVAVDLGDARRRTFYPRTNTYTRKPAIFPFAGNPEGLQLELHTTLPGSPRLRAAARWGQPGKHTRIEADLPEQWGFSCVLRRGAGGGSAVDGFFSKGKPRILGSRHVEPKDLKAAAMSAYLRRLL